MALIVQYVFGEQIRIVHVSELISETSGEYGSGEYDNNMCCVYGNCTCNSLDQALANLTSNVLINIMTDVTLSTLIERSDLQNISIIGHNNPIVNCKNDTGIHFKLCHNCIIEGIFWNRCGSTTIAGLKLNDPSNVTIQNCSFELSLGQVIVLSEVSGNVNINNCNFVNNGQYRDHSTAIHYLSKDSASNIVFNIKNCKFNHNRYAKSLIYIKNLFECGNVTLHNAIFHDNKGVSIYLINQKLYLNGRVSFTNNSAGNGTGMYISDYSTVVFGKNSDVTFNRNSADYAGGAISSRNHSDILFNQNSKVSFNSNVAGEHGAAIYSLQNSHIKFTGNSTVEFNSNIQKHDNRGFKKFRGNIYIEEFVNISFENTATTYFSNNIAYTGGAIYAKNNCHISLKGNSIVEFSNNTGSYGGAVYLISFSSISFGENSITVFNSNTASKYGGAIRAYNYSKICFKEDSTTDFNNNSASNYGGAICVFNNSNICSDGNPYIQFSNNSANFGGAVYVKWFSNMCFEGNSSTMFNDNIAAYYGGAIRAFDNGTNICFEGNSTTEFNGNVALYYGGAICTYKNDNISFEGNSKTLFINNTALHHGGAIFTYDNDNISFEGYSTTEFNNNTALYYGGAISINYNSNILFEGNSTTKFSNNTAKYGGAIDCFYNSFTSFKGSSTTVFNDNIAIDNGTDVYAEFDSGITFDGSSKINFTNDRAANGQTVYCCHNSKVIAKEQSSVVFNDVTAKWCDNICFLLPDHNGDNVIIDSNSIVRCSYQGGFTCLMKDCNCSEFMDGLVNDNDSSIIIVTDTVTLSRSSNASFANSSNISIIGYNNPFVYCVNGSGLTITNSSNIVVEGITWIRCGNSTSKDNNKVAYDSTELNLNILDSPTSFEWIVPVIHLQFSVNVKIQNCVFQYSEGRAVEMLELSGDVNINNCSFVNNGHYRGHGAAIHYSSNYSSNDTKNSSHFLLTINDCNLAYNKFAESLVYIENSTSEQNDSITICDSKFQHNHGVSIYVANHKVFLTGKILFSNNIATDGSGIYITNHSTVIFGENSDVEFMNNRVNGKGSAIFLQGCSTVLFDQNSKVPFHDNNATNGTVCSETSSNVIFNGACQVTFSSNLVKQYGAAIHSIDNSDIIFKGTASVNITNNINFMSSDWNYIQYGGTICSENSGHISFEGNSVTIFNNNTAGFGAAIYLFDKSNMNFKDMSNVTFNNNTANNNGGAIALYDNCTATIEQFSNLTLSGNFASHCGGGLHFSHNSNVSFTDNSVTLFIDNRADGYGGGVCYNINSSVKVEENCTVTFENNTASFGENIYSNGSSYTDIRNAKLIINNITARWHNGGQFTNKNNIINDIIIDANGIVRCNDHKAYYICEYQNCCCENIEDIPSNVVVKITRNISLSSPIQLQKLVNISLIGYNSSSIHCENDGGIRFISCRNVSITNLTWHKFINNEKNNITSLIKFYNSSNLTIDNCTFQQSVGGAIVLSEVSGDLNIKHCKFVNNKHTLREHGGAIHYNYSSNGAEYSKVQLTISDCHFTNNFGFASLIYLEKNYNHNQCESIILKNSKFDNNQGVCVYLANRNLYIKGNVLFDNNEADNGPGIVINDHSNVTFSYTSNVTFVHNAAAINGGAIYVNNWSNVVFENNSYVKFTSNKATRSGGTIYSCNNSGIILKENSTAWFAYGNAEFGGTLYAKNNSFIITKGESKFIISDSEATHGGAIYFKQNSNMAITDNSTTQFAYNKAIKDGGCIFSDYESSITFKGNSTTKFYNNKAIKGGVIYSCNNSDIIIDENSQVWVNYSTAELGGTLYIEKHSYIIANRTSILGICNSKATNGGASYLNYNSNMTITGNSNITFLNNEAERNGGNIYSTSTSSIMFSDTSIAQIHDSKATQGGAIYCYDNSNIIFDENSKVHFDHSTAKYGGTMYIEKHSYIVSKGMSILMISNSEATRGGASYLMHSSTITTTENSTVTVLTSEAKEDGGGIYSNTYSSIMFKGNSTITINNNKATHGGAIYSTKGSNIEFDNISKAFFNMNAATKSGGCIFTEDSTIEFKGTCKAMFNNSVVFNGAGGAFCADNSSINFISCNVTFYKNVIYKGEGGAICCTNSITVFEGTSNVEFDSNEATYGGAADFYKKSKLLTRNNAVITFNNNTAIMGGAVDFHENSNGTFEMNSTLVLRENSAIQNGGAFYLAKHCYIEFKEFVIVEFVNNNAETGGAIFLLASEISFKNCSILMFKNNTASKDGGAIYVCDHSHFTLMEGSNVTFFHNRASDYGGAIYSEMISGKMTFGNFPNHTFPNNSAGTSGNHIYMNLPRHCNSTCLNEGVLGIKKTEKDLESFITTSPNKIQLYNFQCIDFGNDTICDKYYVKNIMLGQKIVLDACLYDYYNHSINVSRFLISGTNDQGYHLDSTDCLIICRQTREVARILGNESTTFNYSINISLYDNRQSESKEVMTKLMIELSPCHPGFSYNKNSQKCECYSATEDIVLCSGSSSDIKRGYWFGNVTGKPTTTFCPINYCNFTCCETFNGYYHLSPVRDNQCSSHRSGTACGNCTDPYTLSYDSTKCVNVDSCTAGHTVLVVLLTVMYWIVMVTLVFGIMYYKIGIGYLYGITYYYSIVDILLNQNMYASRGLYLTVNIMSSFSKIIPQFLGELCLITGLSGIDQQFIHYIHPLAVVLILIIISLIARRSQRISVFISRGIIHVICLLLLLSYTSIASTSLLLMRKLNFDGIDEVYTYLSPDIKFFHDRHLVYGIVAVLFMIFIVIGPPLLLTLEPFLNHRFNFTKIKPLLDQFQGCYKDKYRCFAGYYMICRLVIITIIINDSSNDFVANYLLIITCGIIALIHLLVKPYNSGILNKLDGVILQLVIFTEALSLFDDYDSPLVVTFSFVLVILPLLMIIGIAIFLHKDDLQKRFRVRDKPRSKNELLMADYHLIVSNDMRENATTCDV